MENIRLQDIVSVLKENIKLIVIAALICAVLFSGMGFLSSTISNNNSKEKENALNIYDKWSEYSSVVKEQNANELVRALETMINHPILSINPNDCTSRMIVFTFNEDKEVSRISTVNGWIQGLKCKSLFGTDADIVKKYRYDLIAVSGGSGEVRIDVFDNEKYDLKNVANNIIRIVKQRAKENGIKILMYQSNEVHGFNQILCDKQDIIRNDIVKVINEMNVMNSYSMQAPDDSSIKGGIGIGKLLLLALAGFVFGCLFMIALIVLRIIFKGTIISCTQIKETYSFEKLGNANLNNKESIPIINAVIRAMTENERKIMIVSAKQNKKYEDIANYLDEIDNNKFVYGTTRIENVELIDNVKVIDEIIIPVSIGKTTEKEISNVVAWAQKFKKDILGYIVVSE